ncbi:MAG: response regulator [Gammaproteobacteria bacterium]|nr:response regulator [Gammaproteobacteria bacterium]
MDERSKNLSILFDLSQVLSAEITLEPLLNRFLQRLMYHTGYTSGIILENLEIPKRNSHIIRSVIGDRHLRKYINNKINIEKYSSIIDDDQKLLLALDKLPSRQTYKQLLSLKIPGYGIIILLGNNLFNHKQEIKPMLQPVLANLSKSIKLCQQSEAYTQRLKHEAEELQKLSDMKSSFLANMSHEIRTPMNGVLGMLGLLLESDLNKEQVHKVQLAQSSAESLLTLINDILDFSKIEAGKLELELMDFSPIKLIEEVAESNALKAQSKGVEIIVDVTEINDTLVIGDPGRIRQILNNLISNAIKFTNQGEIIVKSSLKAKDDDNLIFAFSVEDTGIGIEKTKIDYLFDSFTQADLSTTRKYGGTGLGLSISKKLCELMGGEICARSEPDKGSTFAVSITTQKSKQSRAILPMIDLSRLNLLIVDDNLTNLAVLEGQLSLWGAKVTKATGGKKALKICEQAYADGKLFDAAFLDMQMPEMDGSELGKSISSDERYKSLKLIMMTSIAQHNDAKFFASLGFHAYFSKPTNVQDILSALAVTIDNGEALKLAKPLVTHDYLKTLESKKQLTRKFSEGLPKPRILIAEDNRVNQLVARGILKSIGLDGEVAGNGLEVIQALKSSPVENAYDIILMDCQMPEMDGYEATKQIRQGIAGKHNKNICIIAMTANAMRGDMNICIESGMDDYLAKPVNNQKLLERLESWTNQRLNNSPSNL